MPEDHLEDKFSNPFEQRFFEERLRSLQKLMNTSIQSIKDLFTLQHLHLEKKIEAIGDKVDSYIFSQNEHEEERSKNKIVRDENKKKDEKQQQYVRNMFVATIIGWIIAVGSVYINHRDNVSLLKEKQLEVNGESSHTPLNQSPTHSSSVHNTTHDVPNNVEGLPGGG